MRLPDHAQEGRVVSVSGADHPAVFIPPQGRCRSIEAQGTVIYLHVFARSAQNQKCNPATTCASRTASSLLRARSAVSPNLPCHGERPRVSYLTGLAGCIMALGR